VIEWDEYGCASGERWDAQLLAGEARLTIDGKVWRWQPHKREKNPWMACRRWVYRTLAMAKLIVPDEPVEEDDEETQI
jgi:hypothetical protein